MRKSILFLNIIALATLHCFSQSKEVPFTLEDRDRIIQMSEKLNSQQTQINDIKTELAEIKQEIRNLHQEIKDVRQEMKSELNWKFGILFSMMIFLLGYIMWDRKTVTQPIKEHTQSLIQSLREYAKEEPKLADILRSHGLM